MSTAIKLYTVMKAGPLPGETDEQWGLRVFKAAKAADIGGVNTAKFESLASGLPVATGITYDRTLTPEELQVLDDSHNQDCANTLKKNQKVRQAVVGAIVAGAAGITTGGAGGVVAALVPQLLNLISSVTQ